MGKVKLNAKIEIKNINELSELVQQLQTTVDKLKNFELVIEANQYEQNP